MRTDKKIKGYRQPAGFRSISGSVRGSNLHSPAHCTMLSLVRYIDTLPLTPNAAMTPLYSVGHNASNRWVV